MTDKKDIERALVRKYYNSPGFNFLHKWVPIYIHFLDVYSSVGDQTNPIRLETFVLWKSQITGRIIYMDYNYQVSVVRELEEETDDKE